ncbi:MAG TPA: RNA 2',3'-cyclic phosphodiesterase [Steroidobacteraceae bacterium]|nr:RNA 2',3'-cyclic phosphodiesterase [Steroidobacteraceae bacterium]
MSLPKEARRRLFFALWPSAAMQEALASAARRTIESLRSGRPVPRGNLHLTLAFLGSVPESSVEVLEDAARRLDRAGAVTITFDAIEYWARAEILCAAARSAPQVAAAFAQTLKQALLSNGFAPDLKPFRPHVTLARQVRQRPSECALAQVSWTFGEFALMESRSSPEGSLYSVVASWPLYGDEGS